jgi:hypothetical protein
MVWRVWERVMVVVVLLPRRGWSLYYARCEL